jgi:hypothetical protein
VTLVICNDIAAIKIYIYIYIKITEADNTLNKTGQHDVVSHRNCVHNSLVCTGASTTAKDKTVILVMA